MMASAIRLSGPGRRCRRGHLGVGLVGIIISRGLTPRFAGGETCDLVPAPQTAVMGPC
jgi:hypothetical protein